MAQRAVDTREREREREQCKGKTEDWLASLLAYFLLSNSHHLVSLFILYSQQQPMYTRETYKEGEAVREIRARGRYTVNNPSSMFNPLNTKLFLSLSPPPHHSGRNTT